MKLLTSPTWEAGPLPITEGLWDDVIPGNPLEVTSAQSEVSLRCGAKVNSPSRPQEASPSSRGPELLGEDQTKGLRCWEGRKSTDLQSQGPVWLCKARAGCSQEPFRKAPGYGINTVQLPVPPTR